MMGSPKIKAIRIRQHVAVIDRRLDSLQVAISLRDQEGAEFAFDQVRSAVGKLEDFLGSEEE